MNKIVDFKRGILDFKKRLFEPILRPIFDFKKKKLGFVKNVFNKKVGFVKSIVDKKKNFFSGLFG